MKNNSLLKECHEILESWLSGCRRNGKISRNTIAVGIVVLDHLKKNCPVEGKDAVSKGGEIKGARSGLGAILNSYGIPSNYLKEVTTRQGHQDGQKLLNDFKWGNKFIAISETERVTIINEIIVTLIEKARAWLKRQNLKFDIDRRQSPSSWIKLIVDSAKHRSGGIVEQHLIGAKLERRFKDKSISNHPAHAGDVQTARLGDFEISTLVYHVTATPSRNVIQKCKENLKIGCVPILLVPAEQENRALILSQEEGIDKEISIISIEAFVALNIIELATDENKEFYNILKEIIDIYNKRLAKVETDLSLQINVR